MGPPLLLVAHGSRDPRAARCTEALARRVAAARPGLPVAAAYLEHAGPRPVDVVRRWSARRVAVVPLLLTAAYHAGVDVPAVLSGIRADLGVDVRAARVLGGDPAMLDAVDAATTGRPGVSDVGGVSDVDGIVLAAAGTRDAVARRVVAEAATAYGARHRTPCLAAYAAGGGRTVPDAVAALRAAGARRIGVASYFLAPGLLHDRIVDAATASGASLLGGPCGATAPLAGLVLDRYAELCPPVWTVDAPLAAVPA